MRGDISQCKVEIVTPLPCCPLLGPSRKNAERKNRSHRPAESDRCFHGHSLSCAHHAQLIVARTWSGPLRTLSLLLEYLGGNWRHNILGH